MTIGNVSIETVTVDSMVGFATSSASGGNGFCEAGKELLGKVTCFGGCADVGTEGWSSIISSSLSRVSISELWLSGIRILLRIFVGSISGVCLRHRLIHVGMLL